MVNIIIPVEFDKRYPHVSATIHQTWGSSDCRKYMLGILQNSESRFNNRLDRQGFPLAHAKIILDLIEQHDLLYSEYTHLISEPPFISNAIQRNIQVDINVEEVLDVSESKYILLIIFAFIMLISCMAFAGEISKY
jgi:hypothetical protein